MALAPRKFCNLDNLVDATSKGTTKVVNVIAVVRDFVQPSIHKESGTLVAHNAIVGIFAVYSLPCFVSARSPRRRLSTGLAVMIFHLQDPSYLFKARELGVFAKNRSQLPSECRIGDVLLATNVEV